MDHNPYSPPEAKVSDAGPRAPGSQPPLDERLYTVGQVAFATFFGSFLAGAVLYNRNLAATGRVEKKSLTLIVGVVATLISLGVSYMLPERSSNLLLPIMCSVIARVITDITFGKTIKQHLVGGGKKGSWWATIGISVLVTAGILAAALLAAAIYFAIYPEELDSV